MQTTLRRSSSASLARFALVPGLLTAIAASALLAACGGDDDTVTAPVVAAPLANQLYTQTNETANAVVHFTRNADGTLVRAESTATGGAGSNAVNAAGATGPDSLASQHSVVISADAKTLYTVNAGDDSISALSIDQKTGALTLLKKSAATAGHFPNSLALDKGYLYATFVAGTNQLAAYKINTDGSLTQVGAYDLKTLGGLATTAPTQAVVSPDGSALVVNAGTGSNAVMSFPVNGDGTLGTPTTNATQVAAPFAGVFLPATTNPIYLATSISGVSLNEFSYASSGLLTAVGSGNASGVPGVGAPCWVVLNPSGTVAFVGNGSGAISSYSVSPTTGITLLDATAAEEPGVKSGVTAVAADSWVSADGKFLYTAYLGDDKVVAYAIGLSGTLAKLGETTVGTATGLSLQGLAGI